jgi:hypothetical protein
LGAKWATGHFGASVGINVGAELLRAYASSWNSTRQICQ